MSLIQAFSKLAGPRETRTGSMTGNVVSRRIGDVRYGIYTPFRLVVQWVSRGFLKKWSVVRGQLSVVRGPLFRGAKPYL